MAVRAFRYSLSPMQQAVKTTTAEARAGERLTLAEILDWLVADKLVGAQAADELKKERRYYRGTLHPLVIIADQKWRSATPPAKPLTLEALTEWLAKRVGMEYLHIDPLKIDFAAVTDVRSSAYATRFRILPVAVTSKEATIATAEPHLREWEAELARIIKREIRRVIANPLDIERYQVEFYNLAKSIKGAGKHTTGARGLLHFEEVVNPAKETNTLDAVDVHDLRLDDCVSLEEQKPGPQPLVE